MARRRRRSRLRRIKSRNAVPATSAVTDTSASSFVRIAPLSAIAAIHGLSRAIATAATERYATSIASALPPENEYANELPIATLQNAVAKAAVWASRTRAIAQ